ncbi:hypothetical protein [Jiulongibacter sediminis]|jgi:hypothetical protein|uniref:hypothetical protein n=1 Tax=Jiulongibacter sediminis TaxID=1605367 RepID=UPI0026E9238B|nr:hypothetical protein [Jiulongibacter sediminis]
MTKSKVYFFLIAFFAFANARGQLGDSSTEESDQMDSKYFAYGVTTNTHSGILGGLVFRSSTPINTDRKLPVHRYIALEAVNLKHPKESTSSNPALGAKFIFGKTNYFFVVRPEYGREWYFFKKNGDSSIGLSGILAVGPSIGIQKPYYIKYGRDAGEAAILTQYDPDIHTDYNSIRGSSSIWQGFLNNSKINPGIHIKAATSIDMSTFGDNITGFELGTTLELFTREPEIISPKLSTNAKAYATAYLTLYFGNKRLIKK